MYTALTYAKLRERYLRDGFLPEGTDYDSDVVLTQPQFPSDQVRYARHYFKIYVRKFRIAYSLPKFIGIPLEKWWSWCYTTRFKPFKLVNYMYKTSMRLFHGTKRNLMKLSPKLYIKLRNKTVKLKKD